MLIIKKKEQNNKYKIFKTNINLIDEFLDLKEVKEQIKSKNLTYIETLFGEHKKVGNSLIILKNEINICEKIKCKNIIVPSGLESIIKNPIFYKKYNITIYPYQYINKIKIDIYLDTLTIFYFKYERKTNVNRLKILRTEIINNIPKFITNQNEIIIKIRSGDIFINDINKHYSQPPLCFYQKIINENKFEKIYILSNGRENPVINELINLYPKIEYIEGSIQEAVSMIIYSYNLVHSISSFQQYLIPFNNNLENLYVYELIYYDVSNINFNVHKMEPSIKYKNIMQNKWKNTKEQLNLMITEKCLSSNIYSFYKN